MDAKILHELFEYRDGELFWKTKRPSIRVGDRAGWVSGNGYRNVNVVGKTVGEHRVVFAMHHGYFPYHVDHIDGNITNNRIENLRPATKAQNSMNCKLHKSNKSGVKGVYWNKLRNTWNAQLESKGKKIHVGVFKTIEEASKAMVDARNKFHGEFANHGNN